MRSRSRIVVLALLGLSLVGAPRPVLPADPLAAGQLVVQGSQLTVYADEQTNDADQVVDVGERARVRTCFGGVDDPCGSVLAGDPRIAGLVARAELSGPEVTRPIPLEALPGGTFVLPGLQQEGDYRLENIRLVEAATGRVLGAAQPSVALIRVREIVLTSATVRTLTLADLQARGIEIGQDSFQAFDFAVGFAFGSEIVEIELPLLYNGFEPLQPLDAARVSLDGLPEDVVRMLKRWKPPRIMPFVLEPDEEERPRLVEEEDIGFSAPLFGAMVLPGSVSYLNQFFDAQLIVANGAPAGSSVHLTDLGGSIRLPAGGVLRVVASDPSVAPGQRVPVVQATGSRVLDPGEQGSATWTVEGLGTGTHTVAIDVTGQIERPGRDPLPVLSRTQAAIEVVDARFNLTFSHPDVVREGEAYSLFVTVSNLSRATQNLITVDLDEASITGTHREDPNDPLRRTIETLAPGQAETLEYRFVSDLTGKVVATTFQASSSSGQGTIRLRTGVGELGIPLSPATLILPRFSDRLDAPHVSSGEFLRASVRFLGLAHSLAVAPSGQVPPELPSVIPSDVERRAIDLGQAGHRRFLGEPLLETLETLALDQLGNRHPLAGIDELRRALGKGEAMAAELAALVREQQEARGFDAVELLDHFAETASYTAPWLAATLLPDGLDPTPALEIERTVGTGTLRLAGAAGSGAAIRGLPYGEVYPVSRNASGGGEVPLAVIGHLEEAEVFRLVLRNPGTSTAAGRLLVVLPDHGDPRDFRRVDLGRIEVPPGGAVAVDAGMPTPDPAYGGFAAYHASTGAPAGGAASARPVVRPPFRIVGAAQDFRLKEWGPDFYGNMYRPNRHGNGLVYLFNRPPDPELLSEDAFRVRSTFTGLDTAGQPASAVSEKHGTAAFVQDDPRVVAVRYSKAVSPLIDPATGQSLLEHEHLLDTFALVDAWGESADPAVPAPILETDPLHVGGLIEGRVLRGTGEPAEGAEVELIRIWLKETKTGTKPILELAGTTVTGPDGAFVFDFVEEPHWDLKVAAGYRLRATVPEGDDPDLEPADEQEVGSRIRLQNRLARINIALLGRGTINGTLVYQDDGSPVPNGSVVATSTLFADQRSAVVAADGSFRIGGVAVGPITLTGSDPSGRRVYATVGIEEPGATVDVRLEIPRAAPALGTVTGRVVRFGDGDPVAGAVVQASHIGYGVATAITDALGRFRFEDLPAGQITLQAAAWEVSRSSVVSSLSLAAGETRDVTLRLAAGDTRAVTGRVVFHDPITNTDLPVEGAVAFINGPGVFAYTDADGRYRIEDVPVQGVNEPAYAVQAIDYGRGLRGSAGLPPILDATADVVEAQPIVLERMSGGIDGVVLDPLGRPLPNAEVRLYTELVKTTTGFDGSFSFDDVGVGDHLLVAHVGDGLQPGQVGYFGDFETRVVYGGHRPFVTLRMRGSGVVTLHTTTATATGILTPIYYKPTWFHDASWRIKLKGSYIEATTDPNGDLELELPVGEYEIIAYNPFHGIETISDEIDYAGQVQHHEIVFEDAGTVAGQVVDVDGRTPVPDIEVTLATEFLEPQTLRTDAQGRFRFELVPKGRLSVTAAGLVGSVERVGRTMGQVTLGGEELDLLVRMKAQGTVRGRVVESVGGELRPLPFAQYYVRESGFPHRRLPQEGTFFVTDAEGRYQVSHLYAGDVTVVARDSSQVSRRGTARGTIATDWEVVDLPEVVLSTSVGGLEVVVRDPQTGGPVADAQVRLSELEWTVSGPDGSVRFDALALGTYSIYAFHAPTGRSGRISGLSLSSPGQELATTVYLDQRGEVRGTLYDDASLTVGVPAGIVELTGQTAGGRLQALTTTSSAAGEEGAFSFLGIPEGEFDLEAAVQTSSRRARAEAGVTETSPVADVVMVLEPVADLYVRLYESLTAGVSPVDLASGLFSARVLQDGYDFTRGDPEPGTDVFRFPDILVSRPADLHGEEHAGERRSVRVRLHDVTNPTIEGAGDAGDPFRLVLRPRGAVGVTVIDGTGAAVPDANVTLNAAGTLFPSVSGSDGRVAFAAVPAGALVASATSPATGTGGTARGTLTYDDEVVELTVQLAPAVAAHGTIFEPVADDRPLGSPSERVPAAGIIVEIRDSRSETQVVLTGADGGYRFPVLPTGGYTLTARDQNGDRFGSVAGTLVGPDGYDNPIPDLVLDASPPRIVSIVPPPGLEGVSRTAPVEIVFSEALDPAVLPAGQATSPFFRLAAADGTAPLGAWTSSLDPQGFQVVRFTPSQPYENFTTYSLTVEGGPNGVRDRVGRHLTASGDVGSNFKTSDGIGPEVIATDPSLDLPVDPARSIRFDFNEAVEGGDELFDGDGVDDAVALHGLDGDGVWVRLPVTLSLTRSGYSVEMRPVGGLTLDGDTLRRRVVVSGLSDGYGNPMPVYERTFRLYDGNSPVVDAVPFPDGAPDGQLTQGVDYRLLPVLSGLDDVTPEQPGGDLARVDYYFEDPTDPTRPVAPSYQALAHPFAFDFVGAYSGDGVTPRPFPVWVRAVDTSTNASNVVLVEMEVLPNVPPAVGAVTAEAVAPVAGTFYAGSTLRATVSGLADADGSQLTLAVELRADGFAEALADPPDRALARPASGDWADLPPESFDLDLPLDVAEGTPLYVAVRVIDSQGADATLESERHPVADDATPAHVDDLVAKLEDGGPDTTFFLAERFFFEVRAEDDETAVETVTLSLDRTDLFPEAPTVTPVAGVPGLYRTSSLTVPVDGVTEEIPVLATVTVIDRGGNEAQRTLPFAVAPEPDPTAPTGEWIAPWNGAPWPADHASVTSPDGTALLLRVDARDFVEDATGELLPGNLVSVTFRGPWRDPDTGAIGISPTSVGGSLVAGSDGPGRGIYEAIWRVPDGIAAGLELPFEVRLVDGGGTETIERLRMTAVPARRTYEGVATAIAPDDPMLAPEGVEPGAVFLLDGSTVSLRPQDDGSVRRLPSVHLYTGGRIDAGALVAAPSVLTAPEITTLDSAVLFHPLELAVAEALTVGFGSRVDMSGRGLLGNTATRSAVLPGETAAEPWAGGSHGGRGGYGSPSGGWEGVALHEPGSIYDHLREPSLPGGGGTGSTETPGGNGGGVIRLDARGALVRLDGEVLADGGSGSGGGGAGGAVRLLADRLEGLGRISAAGGAGSSRTRSGGGGGGRIALSYREFAPELDLAARVDVSGGVNDAQTPSAAERRGGPGTVFVEVLDADGAPTAPGVLTVAGPATPPAAITPLPALGDGTVAAIDSVAGQVVLDVARVRGDLAGETVVLETGDGAPLGSFPIASQERVPDGSGGARVYLAVLDPAGALAAAEAELAAARTVRFHGRTRLAAIDATGGVRLVSGDSLLLGPDGATSVDDRTFVTLADGARALLRGEGPEVSVTATPEPGAELLLGSSIELAWEADDPIGLTATETAWSLDGSPATSVHAGEPLAVAEGPVTLTIPLDAAPGEVAYSVTATDLAGRTGAAAATWTVLPNEAPAVTIELAPEVATPAPAGYAFDVVVRAIDREGLASLHLIASGPVTVASQSVPATGTDVETIFTVEVTATADGSEPVVLQAVAEDLSGASTTSGALSVPVAANALPSGTLALAPDAGDRVKPGEATAVVVQASDPDGVATIELQVSGPAAQPVETRSVEGTAVEEIFTVAATAEAELGSVLSVQATITDQLGASFTTSALAISVVGDTDPPVVTLTFTPEAAAYSPGDVVEVTASATDDVAVESLSLSVAGNELSSDGSPLSYSWTVPPVSETTTFAVTAEAVDPIGNVGSAERQVTVEPLADDVPPAIELVCPTSGAVLPLGYELTLSARATDDLGVAWVDFYLDDSTEPFARSTPASGAPAVFDATTAFTLPSSPAGLRFRAEVVDSGNNRTSTEIAVSAVATVDLAADGAGTNDWAALAGQTAVLRSGTLTLDQPVALGGLIVLPGATVERLSSLAPEEPLSIDATGPVYVACGGAIDASAQGYAADSTYPGHETPSSGHGGSHVGQGGGETGETFGSTYRPREAGGGGWSGGRGGGVIDIEGDRVQIDGLVRANGGSANRGGAGGSIWIRSSVLAGGGAVEARSGSSCCGYGSGGGGAIALESTTTDPDATPLDDVSAASSTAGADGGPGSIYRLGPSSTHGDLRLVNGGGDEGRVVLPALGAGEAQAGSGGAVLVTGLVEAVPPYFEGHWVEVVDGSTGSPKGAARITAIDGSTLTLDADVGLLPGDLWQGVYRFDSLELGANMVLASDDPIRVSGETTIVSGLVRTDRLESGVLRIAAGATLTHHASTAGDIQGIELEVGELVVEEGGAIEGSRLGYPSGVTYPDHTGPASGAGGSHLGLGGGDAGETFGSLYRPREPGGGGWSGVRGGGVVRVTAQRVRIDGTIRVEGGAANRGSAGGSVWITTSEIAGTGSIEASGGDACCGYGTGGGGAIAIEYVTVEAGSTLLDSLHAPTWNGDTRGGAGSVYLRRADQAYGDLLLDNGGATGTTVLPALGGGTALAGSGGAVLVTDRTQAVPAYFEGHWVDLFDGATGTFAGTARIEAIGGDGRTLTLDTDLGIAPGDTWQGVYRFDELEMTAGVILRSDDPVRVDGDQVIASGTVRTNRIEAGSLRIAAGATVTHYATTDPARPESLTLEVGELVVEAGGAIDVSALGFASTSTYPGHTASGSGAGGSHMGLGGGTNAGETFGSVYQPQEPGGGGYSGVRGGGVVRIVADRVQVDGEIRADGGSANRGSAGGSVWITTSALAGDGSISANGGDACCGYGTGGGGAIAIRYQSLEAGATLLAGLESRTWNGDTRGGAGTVLLDGPTEAYGDLRVDNQGASGTTVLPSFGAGVAGPGSAGADLVTGLAETIPAYFVGHWIELYDGDSTTPKGAARVVAIGADGTTVKLDTDLGVAEGDLWQGVYRFDDVTLTGGVTLVSDDPIRMSGTATVSAGDVRTREIVADRLVVEDGARLVHHDTTDPVAPESLFIDVRELVVAAGGAIDTTAQGYPSTTTYPGHVPSGSGSGGSHMGRGGGASAGETFGSVYRPAEPGAGGYSGVRGGGVVRIVADRVQIDGAIRSNGGAANRGSAGGSVWITTTALAGSGGIEANGGDACCGYGTGAGGAIAIRYETLEPGATVLESLDARTWDGDTRGGAGTVLVDGPTETFGDLTVDNGPPAGTTVLPALGTGWAQDGSAGATLVSDRATEIPGYFASHWIEVYDGASAAFKGAARIAAIAPDGLTVTLDTDLGVAPGDVWQGVYRFDNVTLHGGVRLESADPIRMAGEARIAGGDVAVDEVRADRLVVEPDSRLRHFATTDPAAPESLTIDVRELWIEAGGAIDVSALGFPSSTTYPGHTASGSGAGGSHMGLGGRSSAGQTFGSVYRPQEPGGGGYAGEPGGGVVRIVAERVQIDGDIRADGGSANRGSAGGSVWIKTGELAGTGSISANGGDACCGYGTGGGGAIAVEYQAVEAGATILDALIAATWDGETRGGAGTIVVSGPGSVHGDLTIDNAGITGAATDLPSLGSGIAQPGSGGDIVVTDRLEPIPGYFVGHWVRVESPDHLIKGTWRIAAVEGPAFGLAPNGTETVDVAEGDEWYGLYRFDSVTVAGNAVLQSADQIEEVLPAPSSAALAQGNGDAPAWSLEGVTVDGGSGPGTIRVHVAPWAVGDADGVSEIRLGDGERWVSVPWSSVEGATLDWTGGPAGGLTLVAFDDHPAVREASRLVLTTRTGRPRPEALEK